MVRKPRVVVAGASGFLGRALLGALRDDFEVVALSRTAGRKGPAGVTWKRGDLFSLLDTERALEGAELAVYLVHSMLPSARLVQGRFEDLDLVVADNFARAARASGVRQIVFVGGLVPPGPSLSRHLASRLEVEETLRASGVPVTALRAGLVVGPSGSSCEMLLRLVRRLPAMVCPAWTLTRTQPVALDDVVAMVRACLGNPAAMGRTADLGGPDVVTYREMLARVARILGLRRLLVPVPLFSPGLSTLWLRLVTGAPRDLVAPLVQSLRHEMVARDRSLQLQLIGEGTPLDEALAGAVRQAQPGEAALDRMRIRHETPLVRSVQRLPLPPGCSAAQVAAEYVRWLPRFLSPLARLDVRDGRIYAFRVGPLRRPLLELSMDRGRSSASRPLLYVTGGLLAARSPRGRLEFREVPGGRHVLAAVHDFAPRLPWWIYRATQALAHLAVMGAFRRHLSRSTEAINERIRRGGAAGTARGVSEAA